MALDLSKTFGSDAVAKPYGDTTSKWNPAERDLIIMLTTLLLAYKPKGENTQQLTAKDIVIITPYAGQRSAIIEGLQAASTQDPAVRAIGGLPTLPEVEVTLPASMRGREAPIVLLSLVSNDHEDPSNIGFIYDLEQLKVSRIDLFTFSCEANSSCEVDSSCCSAEISQEMALHSSFETDS